MKTVCDQIIESIKHRPKEWKQLEHVITNETLGIKIWTANGFSFIRVYSGQGRIYGFIEKYRLWRAIKNFNRYYQYDEQNGFDKNKSKDV